MIEKEEILQAFHSLEIRVGTILSCRENEGLRNPAYYLEIDFGPFGVKTSSAQLTKSYLPNDLMGKQVIGVINFPRKKVGKMWSDVLILGLVSADSSLVTLVVPEEKCENGLRLL